MDIAQIVLLYIHIFVLETAFVEFGHRKNRYKLTDRIYIMSIIKFASFFPLVVTIGMYENYQTNRLYIIILTAISMISIYFFLGKIFSGVSKFDKYFPFISINILYIIFVLIFFDFCKPYIDYFYFLSTLGVCLIYFFFLMSSKEKNEFGILYLVTILMAGSNVICLRQVAESYPLVLKVITTGFLYLCIHINLISHNIRNEAKIEQQAEEQHKKLMEASEHIKLMSQIDTLTGLNNTESLKNFIGNIIGQSDMEFNFILINIDNFKSINNFYGFSEGDKVLKKFAQFLKDHVIRKNFIYRFTADQFGVLYSSDMGQTTDFVNMLLYSDKKNDYQLQEYNITVSIGIAKLSRGSTFEILYKQAEIALSDAKRRGKNRYCIFEENLIKKVDSRLVMERLIREKILQQDFLIYCQPKVYAATGLIVGGEILTRMLDYEGNFLSPSSFIKLSEDIGIIDQIDQIILKKSIDRIAAMEKMGICIPISVNVSAQSFLKFDFVDKLNAMINQSAIQKKNFIIEITENFLLSNMGLAIKKARKLTEEGITLSLDDFGKGYSSINYLVNLPVSEVKIDKSIVSSLLLNQRNTIILSKTIELLKEIDLNVVIEGVETQKQLNMVMECGGTIYQGYYAYKPMPVEDFINLIRQQNDKINRNNP